MFRTARGAAAWQGRLPAGTIRPPRCLSLYGTRPSGRCLPVRRGWPPAEARARARIAPPLGRGTLARSLGVVAGRVRIRLQALTLTDLLRDLLLQFRGQDLEAQVL